MGRIDTELNAPMLKRAMEARLAGEDGRAGIRDVSDLRNFYGSDAALAFLDTPWSVIFLECEQTLTGGPCHPLD